MRRGCKKAFKKKRRKKNVVFLTFSFKYDSNTVGLNTRVLKWHLAPQTVLMQTNLVKIQWATHKNIEKRGGEAYSKE